MDHLQLALDEPPAATFRPILRALRIHAIETGSVWTAIDLLDVEIVGGDDGGARGPTWPSRRPSCSSTACSRGPGPGRPGRRRWRWSPATTGRCWPWRRPRCARGTPPRRRCSRRCWSGGCAPPPPRPSGRACSAAWRCWPRRIRSGTAEALALWARALDEDGGRGTAALARAGVRRVAAQLGNDGELARAVGLEAERRRGAGAGCLAGAGGGAGPPPAGRDGAGRGRCSKRRGPPIRTTRRC